MNSEYTVKYHAPERKELTNDEIVELHVKAHKDRLLKTVFYDGSCRTPQEFMRFVKDPAFCFMAVYDKNLTPAACCWLNGFSGRAALINFFVYRDFFGCQSFDIGHMVCDICLKPNEHGEAFLDTLYGITPRCNRAALGFVEGLGFKRIARLPNVCDFNGRIMPGILTIKEYEHG